MVLVEGRNKQYSMDGYMKSNLDIIKEQINNHDNDFVCVVDGFEGVGKSVCAMQIGHYVDPTLTIDRICFSSDDFKDKVLNAEKGQCIIYDEAITGAFSREAILSLNVMLIKLMAQIRQKNLFIIMVLPSFFDLDKNLALWRSKFLVHCHYGKNYQRGFFRFANLDKKKEIYIEGKKLYKYPKSPNKWSFYGRFTKHYTIDEKIYRAKKLKSLKDEDQERLCIRKLRLQRDSFIVYLKNMNHTQEDISYVSDFFDEGVSQQAINKVLIKHNKKQLTKRLLTLKTKYGGVEPEKE